jgi:hypothetical protein
VQYCMLSPPRLEKGNCAFLIAGDIVDASIGKSDLSAIYTSSMTACREIQSKVSSLVLYPTQASRPGNGNKTQAGCLEVRQSPSPHCYSGRPPGLLYI